MAETVRMATWAGRLIPRERRMEIGLENLKAITDLALEDLEAAQASIVPSKRSVRFTEAVKRLEGRLVAAREEAQDAQKEAQPTL